MAVDLIHSEKLFYKQRKPIIYYVDKNGCHIEIMHSSPWNRGYLSIYRNGKSYAMHRYLYEKKYGPIPKGLILRHVCDNPSCINVAHLKVGTQQDNMNDMCERGRHAKGTKIYSSKLSEQDVLKIYSSKMTTKDLAKRFKVCAGHISAIKHGRTWAWLTA